MNLPALSETVSGMWKSLDFRHRVECSISGSLMAALIVFPGLLALYHYVIRPYWPIEWNAYIVLAAKAIAILVVAAVALLLVACILVLVYVVLHLLFTYNWSGLPARLRRWYNERPMRQEQARRMEEERKANMARLQALGHKPESAWKMSIALSVGLATALSIFVLWAFLNKTLADMVWPFFSPLMVETNADPDTVNNTMGQLVMLTMLTNAITAAGGAAIWHMLDHRYSRPSFGVKWLICLPMTLVFPMYMGGYALISMGDFTSGLAGFCIGATIMAAIMAFFFTCEKNVFDMGRELFHKKA